MEWLQRVNGSGDVFQFLLHHSIGGRKPEKNSQAAVEQLIDSSIVGRK